MIYIQCQLSEEGVGKEEKRRREYCKKLDNLTSLGFEQYLNETM